MHRVVLACIALTTLAAPPAAAVGDCDLALCVEESQGGAYTCSTTLVWVPGLIVQGRECDWMRERGLYVSVVGAWMDWHTSSMDNDPPRTRIFVAAYYGFGVGAIAYWEGHGSGRCEIQLIYPVDRELGCPAGGPPASPDAGWGSLLP